MTLKHAPDASDFKLEKFQMGPPECFEPYYGNIDFGWMKVLLSRRKTASLRMIINMTIYMAILIRERHIM